MKVRRLVTMGVGELACRGRQEASKWLERVSLSGRPNGRPHAIFRRLAPTQALAGVQARVLAGDLGGASRTLLDRFQEASPGRFFVGAVDPRTAALLAARSPRARDEALAAAEATCQRRFDLLGYQGLSFGNPIDWHLDPISGRRAPLLHWSRLDPLDPESVGDSKVIWELNRHQWLVQLGLAYQLTRNERLAEMFSESVQEWMRANPPGVGINWASSLEVALRLIAWCWTLFLFQGSAPLSPDLFVRMLSGIRAHASHVERYLSTYFSPNTHLTGEALGLLYAGIVCPELREARRWRALGMRILLAESERQILPDGVYFEQAACYHRYTVEIYLHFLILAARNEIPVPAAIGGRAQKLLDFLLAIRRPDGSIPPIGDADGGWLLPLVPRAPDDPRGVFSIAAAVFGRTDYAWAAGGLAPETLWLLGANGLAAFDALDPAPPAMPPSRPFAEGGYVVMQSGWDAEAHQLILDVGPLGCPVSGGHGHADLLSIHCSAFGEPFLADAGTYCYTGEPEWRDFFRSTAAHSTVMVDGRGQALPAGPFRWNARPRARLCDWRSTEACDFADALHDAYHSLPHPVAHRRRVLFVKPRYWVLVDDLDGGGTHRVELRFQFAPMEVSLDADLWARAVGRWRGGLLLRPFSTVPLTAQVCAGGVAPPRGWISPNYGQRQPAPILTYSTEAGMPLRIVTLLLPVDRPQAPPPSVSPLVEEGRGIVGLSLADRRERVRFEGPDAFTVSTF